MEFVKSEKKARILPLKKNVLGSVDFEVAEVTRSIFSGVWNTYIDESAAVAMSLANSHTQQVELKEVVYPISTHLSLVE